MPKYAGLGSRKTPNDILIVMEKTAEVLAESNHLLRTGACKGADQAFVKGAINANGNFKLYLPWENYEKQWVDSVREYHCIVKTLNSKWDGMAYYSVNKYHPASEKLSEGGIKLHARNYLIVKFVDFIICWTPNGKVTGGTGQALRIAKTENIPVYNLGKPSCLNTFVKRLRQLGKI